MLARRKTEAVGDDGSFLEYDRVLEYEDGEAYRRWALVATWPARRCSEVTQRNGRESARRVSEVARLTKNRCGRLHDFVGWRGCVGDGVGVHL